MIFSLVTQKEAFIDSLDQIYSRHYLPNAPSVITKLIQFSFAANIIQVIERNKYTFLW